MNNEIKSNIAKGMISEFTHEVETTRRFLERVPEDKLSWKPHPKSMTAGQLAFHIASLLKGVLSMALPDESEFPNMGEPYEPKAVAEILSKLDESRKFVLETLPSIDDDRMHQNVRIKKDGKVILDIPRVAFLRMVLLNHWYHHRGQLGVYLRLAGAQVPSSYGPSGDEAPQQN